MTTELIAICIVVIATFFGAFGSLFLKKGAKHFSLHPIKLVKNKQLIIGVLLYGLSSVLFIPALKFGELSIIYPITSLSYIWVALISVKYLNEKMNKYKWIGIFFIILGVVLIAL